MLKKIIIILSILLITGTPVLAQFSYSYRKDNNLSIVCQDKYEWRYKLEKGVLYKRLWNISTTGWETGWIPC
ncbi:MAG: hypothetical protein ACI4WM_02300 [Erysipelotrichaceae bacterium]